VVKRLFTERHGEGKARVAESVDDGTREGLPTLASDRIDEDWFGHPTSEGGNTVGEQGPRARCSLGQQSVEGSSHVGAGDLRAASAEDRDSLHAGYGPSSSSGALCRPSGGATAREVANRNPVA
jgi:hypothetical protein